MSNTVPNPSPHVESKPAHTPGLTPGPWRWLSGHTLMGDHGRRPIVLSSQRMLMRGEDGLMVPNDPHSPNAALIASSPTMYAYIARKAQEGDADAQAIISTL